MLITIAEYKEMGFDAEDDALLEKCIKRAGFVLGALTRGKCHKAARRGGYVSECVKTAAAFQAYSIYLEESALAASSESGEQSGASSKSDERVSIGDFTYSSGSSTSSSQSSTSKTASQTGAKPLDINQMVTKLLRAAGCFYGGTEVK